jgi:hypothetical protein
MKKLSLTVIISSLGPVGRWKFKTKRENKAKRVKTLYKRRNKTHKGMSFAELIN